MKKLILALIVVLSISTGCAQSNVKTEETPKEEKIVYCSECAAESKEESKYCKECGKETQWLSQKPQIKKEEKDTDSEKTETSDTANKKEEKDSDSEKTETSDTSNKKEESEYDKGYKKGYEDGYYKAQIGDNEWNGSIKSDYDRGYAKGFDNGWTQCVADGKDYESKNK
ncbi:hypothetical protein [Terrisporobacter mayombei]|uniref:Zinc ribbon domain-containing protein n=1 Tax=Terrisporobacter mayombei TaxID=1541 RepID=A0ABY9PYL0_9FIRM|nr:hypothetical protein [Terrisporobacter mayombei]MCC3868639.1 hypothetical protein [Terrisporobacter mayombei]WMT80795.1 hypothetical protein TEMA_11170 [Terrisporobacter mayombei]